MSEAMSRREKLERWATVLEDCGATSLRPFHDLEFIAARDQDGLRVANSPLAVAYRDPLLRQSGLGSDRFGDGVEFFGLSRRQAHRVLCSCGYLGTMRGTEVARRIRKLATPERRHAGGWPGNPLPAFARWWSALAGAFSAA
jgi:hypothetical protein